MTVSLTGDGEFDCWEDQRGKKTSEFDCWEDQWGKKTGEFDCSKPVVCSDCLKSQSGKMAGVTMTSLKALK